MSLYSLILSFFILMDSIGNVPIFLALLRHVKPKRQRIVIIREMCVALALMIVFYFMGEIVLKALNVTHSSLLVSGGIILFLIAIKMIFPAPKEAHQISEAREPYIVPLAIPLIAGPAVLASIMLYASGDIPATTVLSAITIAWGLSLIILLAAPFLQRLLGHHTLNALERLMGLILTMMAVQMILEGLQVCFKVPM